MRIAAQFADATYGQRVAGVRTRLESAGTDGWRIVAEAETDLNGRIEDWGGQALRRGLYRIVLDSDGYFAGLGMTTVYPEISIVFRAEEAAGDCQVNVALSRYSYSTYVGPVIGG
jgi:5-hydroxyisourate hydrolase